MATKRIVMYKCLYCNERFNRKDLVTHVEEKHEEMIPKGFTPLRLVFNYVNKKPLDYHGKCTECGKSTPWDENKGRYDRQCGSKACHDSFVKKFEDNMMKTRGTTRISATKEGQKKMLENRKISGKYKMQDGTEKTYTGSYELKALEFMDKILHIKSDDILCPGPILEYSFNGKTHIYITDFYYQPYNLIIEVKDGGDNPNKRNMPEYRAKQIAKEQYIIKHTNYNYLRLTNNNLEQLLIVFADLKYQLVENTGERVIHVNEGETIEGNPILEYMNALMTGKVPGIQDSDCIIVNYMQNNVLSQGLTDGSFSNVVRRSSEGVLTSKPLTDDEKLVSLFKAPITKHEAARLLTPYFGKVVPKNFIYETITNKKMYSEDELQFTLESINDKFISDSELLSEFESFLGLNNNEIDSISESLERIKTNG